MDYRKPNPSQETYRLLEALPKIDLHRHLEGSLRLNTLAEIAKESRLEYLPGYDIEDFRQLVQIVDGDRADADVFLSKFVPLRHFYRSAEIIERVAYEAVADAAAENIIYLELRFTPQALAREMDYPLTDAADWVIKGVESAQKDFDILVRLIVSMNRHESVEVGEECLELAIDRIDKGIVGVDLAGAENEYPGKPFAPIFKRAREAGLQVTIHAGEWAGPESIEEAIKLQGASRLGHGVRILQDSEMLRIAREHEIAFEVCPTSNYQSGVTPTLAQHPLKTMYHMGLKTTINTDDPSISGINLTDEMVTVVEHLDFTIEDVKQHLMNAAEHCFLEEEERKHLVERMMRELYLTEHPSPAKPSESNK